MLGQLSTQVEKDQIKSSPQGDQKFTCRRDFPGGAMVKNLPGIPFDPRSGKIPHAMEQLSPRATATEPVL